MDFRQFSYFLFGTLFGGMVGATAILALLNRSPLDDNDLVVGVVSIPSTLDKKKYEEDFKDYLTQKLGSKIDIEIDVYEIRQDTSFDDIQDNVYEPIEDKNWDIVFALTPFSSLKAHENEYTFLARMFWRESTEPTPPGIFFVRSDSPIENFKDITDRRVESDSISEIHTRKANDFVENITNSNNLQYAACRGIKTESPSLNDNLDGKPKIALGSPSRQESAFTFYIPLYHLYGSSFFADTDNSQCEILVKVLSGQVDVGVGIPPIPIIKDAVAEKLIREISPINQEKVLPYSGVFLSPDLSKRDQTRISKVLLSASEEMMEELHYVDNQKIAPDYNQLASINTRVEEIISCLNWQNRLEDSVIDLYGLRNCRTSSQ